MAIKVDHGFIILDKPQGMTSQGLVSRVKRTLGVKKAGHTGTLDPLATGVLPLALGEATKVIPFLDETVKVYQVCGRLGQATNTMDADGDLVREGDASEIKEGRLQQVLKEFLGESLQQPPAYSAIKFKGKPLYRYARQGKPVTVASRKVAFFDIRLESFQNPLFHLTVRCSRGTYVRSFVHDVGEILGCYAHVTQLRRIRTGPFGEEHAVKPESLSADAALINEKILSIEDCLADLPAVNLLSERELKEACSGGGLRRVGRDIVEQGWTRRTVALKYAQKVVALVQADPGAALDYQRVLNRF